MEFFSLVGSFISDYQKTTPRSLKLLDVFLGYVMLTGVVQFVYVLLVGTFPFNSFLAGFISCVGTFILTVCLRLQINPATKFRGISRERAFFDWVVANCVLHLWVMNFMG